MSKVITISTEQEFDRILSSNPGKLVVVDFNAEWCGPCKMISPIFDRLSSTYTNVVFLSVNVDQV
ncbi:thioredoxin domain-containing protein, partial [Rozella allomycis CSF55]